MYPRPRHSEGRYGGRLARFGVWSIAVIGIFENCLPKTEKRFKLHTCEDAVDPGIRGDSSTDRSGLSRSLVVSAYATISLSFNHHSFEIVHSILADLDLPLFQLIRILSCEG